MKVKTILKKYVKNEEKHKLALEGISHCNIVIIPKSGFFLLVNFAKIKNYSKIRKEEELLKYLYETCGVKFLVGQSFSWPNENEIIIRITYSLDKKDLIEAFLRINVAIRELIKNETN